MLQKINNLKTYCDNNRYEILEPETAAKLIGLGFNAAYQDKIVSWPLFVNEFQDDTALIVNIPTIDLKNKENNRLGYMSHLIEQATHSYTVTFVKDYDEFSNHMNVARVTGDSAGDSEFIVNKQVFDSSEELFDFIRG